MLDELLGWLAPHYCVSCGEIGSLLCDSCKYDIISEPADCCLLCGRPSAPSGACKGCRSPFERTWHVGERSGAIEELINQYKFHYAVAATVPLGGMLLSCLPKLPAGTVIVPVPTIRAHVRQRGYDHTLLLARYIARQLGVPVERPITRLTTTVQRGAGRKQRLVQAGVAFTVRGEVLPGVPYLLIDDVVTTGATITHAAKALCQAGATEVWAAAIARQPLD